MQFAGQRLQTIFGVFLHIKFCTTDKCIMIHVFLGDVFNKDTFQKKNAFLFIAIEKYLKYVELFGHKVDSLRKYKNIPIAIVLSSSNI